MESRYEAMSSHDPHYKFMVWDWEDNAGICFCWDKRHCELIADALNENIVAKKFTIHQTSVK